MIFLFLNGCHHGIGHQLRLKHRNCPVYSLSNYFLQKPDGIAFTLIVSQLHYHQVVLIAKEAVIANFASDKSLRTSSFRLIGKECACTAAQCHPAYRLAPPLVVTDRFHTENTAQQLNKFSARERIWQFAYHTGTSHAVLCLGRRFQRADIQQAKLFRHAPTDAAWGVVQVCMCRIHPYALLNSADDGTLHIVLARDMAWRTEKQRMMAHDEVTAPSASLVNDSLCHVKAQ